MAMTVTYLTVEGDILSETRVGMRADYIPDPLGSTAALINSSHTISDTFSWWPYGEQRSHSGSSLTPFGYDGRLGYYSCRNGALLAARERTLSDTTGQWLTVDELWPDEHPYAYVDGSPASCTDRFGRQKDDPIETSIKQHLGKGPKECNQWMQAVLADAGITPPPGLASTWADYCKSHPGVYVSVPNDGKSPGPHCLICTTAPGGGMGHVEITDAECWRVSASHKKRSGKKVKRLKPGEPIHDLDPSRHGTITVWRLKPRKKC